MKKSIFVNSFFLILIICSWGQNNLKRPMTIDDALKIKNVENILISPNGKMIFYSVSSCEGDEKEIKTTHYLSDADGKNKKEILKDFLEGENFKFSPDSQLLTFIIEVEEDDNNHQENNEDSKENKQIFIFKINSGDTEQLTYHSVSINNYIWDKNGNGIIFIADAIRTPEEQTEYKEGTVAVFVDEGSNGRSRVRANRIWYQNLEKKKEILICDKDLVISELDISNDSKKIAFIGKPDGRTNYPHLAEVYTINCDGSEFKQLTKNGSPEEEVSWSPDNETIIFNAPYETIDEEKYILSVGFFWVYNTTTGEAFRLESKHSGESIGGIKSWSPDGKYYYFHELKGTNTNLYRIEVKTDKLKQLSNFKGSIYPKSFSKDFTKMLYTFEDYKNPADIYLSDPSMNYTHRITDLNSWIRNEIILSTAQPIKWNSTKDNLEIEGMFYLPPNLPKDEKSKLLLYIHGGPMGVVENRFRARFHIYGGYGYSVLGPNFRGSTGYGDSLIRGLMGEIGDGEHSDLLSGVDYVIDNYNVDPNKMAVKGWSWGGVSTGFLITHCHRFKAASAGAGVYNWLAEHGPGFCYDVWHWYIGEPSWKNPEEWRKRSAINYAKNVKTPLILFHGDADEAASSNQSLTFFSTLKEINKVPVRYIMFPGQDHGFSDPRSMKIEMAEEIKWIRKHVEGID